MPPAADRPAEFQPLILTAADGASAGITPYGAHVVSWKPAPRGFERLFLSRASEFRPGVAIRGGVPVIFPQFAAEGPLPKHGFARTAVWTLESTGPAPGGGASARFGLRDSAATRAVWPHAFHATLTATVGGASLEIALEVTNDGSDTATFTAALHSYFSVSHIADVTVRGLAGTDYRDSAAGGTARHESAQHVRIEGEVDRIYLQVPGPVAIEDAGRLLEIESPGFTDVVVWNPGADKGAALGDLEPQGFERFLCVESAVIGEPVHLAPAATWRGVQRLHAR